MSYQAGDTYPAALTVRDADGALADPTGLGLSIRDPEFTVTTFAYPSATIVRDGVGQYHSDVPLTRAGPWVVQWNTTNPAQAEGVQIIVSPAPTAAIVFATIDDLALRMGGELSAVQSAQGAMLLELVTGLIVDAVGRDDAWAAAYAPVRRELRAVALEAVSRAMANPAGARSESEQIGAYQHSQTFTDGGHGLLLTDAEVLLVRRAVLGATSASAHVRSLLPRYPTQDLYDWLEPVYPFPGEWGSLE